MGNMRKTIPPRLPVSPLSLTCPYCKAERGTDCAGSNGISVTHVERIQMAGLADKVGRLRTRAEKRARRAAENGAS